MPDQLPLWDPYRDDFLPGVESYVTHHDADVIVSNSLHSDDWPTTPAPIFASEDDPYYPGPDEPFVPPPEHVAIVTLKRNALRDASQLIGTLPLAGRKTEAELPLAFPRTGLRDAEGNAVSSTLIPKAVERATAFLAAHLVKQRQLGEHAAMFVSNRVGESSAVYRAPSLDDLPRHVRKTLEPFLRGSASYSPVSP
jgi:hypothetical protein